MAYTTVNGVQTAAAVTFAGDSLSGEESAEALDSLLRRAERRVRRLAPSDGTAEYRSAAADAEMSVFKLLASREPDVQSESNGGRSVTYTSRSVEAAVLEVVRDIMEGWFAGDPSVVPPVRVSAWNV